VNIFLNKFLKLLILIVINVLLVSCSSTQLIYSIADKFIQDEVEYFLDLNEKERVILNQEISEIVIWHRKSMLPKYSNYLVDISNKLEIGDYDTSNINKAVRNARFLIEETVTGLTPFASQILMRHRNVEAVKFIEKKMEMRRQERLEELSQPKDMLYKERLERLLSSFERFMSSLNEEQVKLLEAHASATLLDNSIRLKNRTMRQKVFIEFLKTQPDEEELTAYLNKLLLRGYEITNPTYQDFLEASLERFEFLLGDMLAVSTELQKKKIVKKLRSYSEDFKTVSR